MLSFVPMVLTILITLSWGTRQSITTRPWACTTRKVCSMFSNVEPSRGKSPCIVSQAVFLARLFHFEKNVVGRRVSSVFLWLPSKAINHGAIISHRGHLLGSARSTLKKKKRREEIPTLIYWMCIQRSRADSLCALDACYADKYIFMEAIWESRKI